MKNVSNACLREMELRRDFYCEAEITFPNGTVKELGRDDFAISGNGVVESAEISTFPLGAVIPKRITLSLNNYDDRWSEFDFQWAKIFLKTKFDLSSGTTEVINVGNFTIITPESYGTIVEISAMDDGYKLDKEYSTNLTYPVSAGVAFRDSCSTCGVSYLTGVFDNDDYVIPKKPENLTHRNFIGLCAMLAGGNARFDGYNRLQIVPYDFSRFRAKHIDGGIFDTGNPNIYETGDNIDGGSFSPWNTGGIYNGGSFGDRKDLHVLFAFSSGLTIATDDVVITGLKLKSSGEEEYMFGKEGYILSAENQLAEGKEQEVAAMIGEKVVGLKFRPFSGDHAPYPLAEFGDLALLVDRKQNIYQTVITDADFSYYGTTSLKCSAENPIRNSSKYNSEAAKAIVESKKLIEKEKTERERAMEELERELAQSSGLYMTKEEQEDGKAIYYMHDKPALEESMIVWKLTVEAFGISTDGGKSYPYGLDITGLAILNRIYAIGINCNYLTTGAFEIRKDEKVMVLMDKDLGQVVIRPDVFELFTKYFAVTEDGEMYSNDPVVVGYLRMAGTVGESLSVSAARRISTNTMELSFVSSSAGDTGTYILKIGKVGTQPGGWEVSRMDFYGDAWFLNGVRLVSLTPATSGSVLIANNNGDIHTQSSSSKKYKDVKRNMSDSDIEDAYGISPVIAKYKDGYLQGEDERSCKYFPMFLAEDVEMHLPSAVIHGKNGEAENWDGRVLIPVMFQMLKSQKEKIEKLEKRMKLLEGKTEGGE